MRNRLPWAMALALGVMSWGAASESWAQWGGGFGGGWGGGGWGGGWGYHSSTAAEGYQRGFADVVRSEGIANLLNSEASINYEDARSKAYDNALKGTQTYFTMRKMNEQYRSAERGTPATSEQLFRWAHRDVPRALNSYEFDSLSGQINWPLLLRAPGYEDYRHGVEQYFRMRSEMPQKVDELTVVRTQELFDNWLMTLKGDIKAFKPNEYIRSRKFLESLALEASKT